MTINGIQVSDGRLRRLPHDATATCRPHGWSVVHNTLLDVQCHARLPKIKGAHSHGLGIAELPTAQLIVVAAATVAVIGHGAAEN